MLALDGGTKAAVFHSGETRHLLFWLFLGGFVWVIGDLFQQFATKYLGIGRGIPLSNTNQMWGLAWGALVFGELAHADAAHRLLVVVGSLVMICGALAVTTAVATEKERGIHARGAGPRVRPLRPRLRPRRASRTQAQVSVDSRPSGRAWWDYAILAAAVGVFVWLGVNARVPELSHELRLGRRACGDSGCLRRRRCVGLVEGHPLLLISFESAVPISHR